MVRNKANDAVGVAWGGLCAGVLSEGLMRVGAGSNLVRRPCGKGSGGWGFLGDCVCFASNGIFIRPFCISLLTVGCIDRSLYEHSATIELSLHDHFSMHDFHVLYLLPQHMIEHMFSYENELEYYVKRCSYAHTMLPSFPIYTPSFRL